MQDFDRTLTNAQRHIHLEAEKLARIAGALYCSGNHHLSQELREMSIALCDTASLLENGWHSELLSQQQSQFGEFINVGKAVGFLPNGSDLA